ncbi:MAG TPA: DoxX family protein [Gemmatimonadaceae bacterium]|jgi:putative oxidoreductase|nr:DoxX family protein [Gemmatimonadaceae bacterium]
MAVVNTSRMAGPVLSLLRIVAAIVYLQHGIQKLTGALGGHVVREFPSFQGFGMVIECGAGVLILVGLFTRVAAFLAAGEMAVAYFKFHAPHGFWPVVNHGEVPTLLCFIFLYLAAAGGGPLSVDAVR